MKKIFSFLASMAMFLYSVIVLSIVVLVEFFAPFHQWCQYAITQNILFGRMKGKIGNLITYTNFGQNVVRSKPLTINDAGSAVQLAQRSLMSAVVEFCRIMLGAIQIGYSNFTTEMSAFSYALSQTLLNAKNANDPPDGILLSSCSVSKGNLIGIPDVTYTPESGLKVSIEWTNNSENGNALETDVIYVAWVRTDMTMFGSELVGSVKRSHEEMTISCDGCTAGDEIRVYVFLGSADLSIISESQVSAELTLLA